MCFKAVNNILVKFFTNRSNALKATVFIPHIHSPCLKNRTEQNKINQKSHSFSLHFPGWIVDMTHNNIILCRILTSYMCRIHIHISFSVQNACPTILQGNCKEILGRKQNWWEKEQEETSVCRGFISSSLPTAW